MNRVELPSKLIGETKTYSVDFLSQLAVGETISAVGTTIASVYSGTDVTPSAIISGSATASGSTVSQKLTAGTLGVIYQVLFSITTSTSQILQITGLVAITPTQT